MVTSQMALREQSCANCRYARRSTLYEPDGSLTCRYLPPQPYPSNAWRVVPEDFWCGCWERGPLDPLQTASRNVAAHLDPNHPEAGEYGAVVGGDFLP